MKAFLSSNPVLCLCTAFDSSLFVCFREEMWLLQEREAALLGPSTITGLSSGVVDISFICFLFFFFLLVDLLKFCLQVSLAVGGEFCFETWKYWLVLSSRYVMPDQMVKKIKT